MTAKKRAFVEYYKIHRNATEAAKMAGYSQQTATTQGHRLVRDVDIKRAIEAWEAEERENVAKLVPSKDNFILNTFRKESQCEHWPTRAKLWELGGKALGYLEEQKTDIGNALNILIGELHLSVTGPQLQSDHPNTLDITPDAPSTNSSACQDNSSNASPEISS